MVRWTRKSSGTRQIGASGATIKMYPNLVSVGGRWRRGVWHLGSRVPTQPGSAWFSREATLPQRVLTQIIGPNCRCGRIKGLSRTLTLLPTHSCSSKCPGRHSASYRTVAAAGGAPSNPSSRPCGLIPKARTHLRVPTPDSGIGYQDPFLSPPPISPFRTKCPLLAWPNVLDGAREGHGPLITPENRHMADRKEYRPFPGFDVAQDALPQFLAGAAWLTGPMRAES